MRALMALIGYVSTATVLALGIGMVYLWQTERLDDEKMFRIVALVHDVDVDGLAAEELSGGEQTPDEEPSLEDIASYRAVSDRNHEVKEDALKRGRQEFDHSFDRLRVAMDRFDNVQQKVKAEFERQGELSSKEAVSKVVRDLEMMGPDNAKGLLLRTLDEPEGMNDVILLMTAMQPAKLKKILNTFRDPPELDKLHEIHKEILTGGSKKELMQEAFEQLQTLEP